MEFAIKVFAHVHLQLLVLIARKSFALAIAINKVLVIIKPGNVPVKVDSTDKIALLKNVRIIVIKKVFAKLEIVFVMKDLVD